MNSQENSLKINKNNKIENISQTNIKNFTQNINVKFILIPFFIISIGLLSYVKFYILPKSATSLIETMSESYGLDITISNITTDISDLKVNFEDVVWQVRGRYSSNELFTAATISFDISLVNFLSNGFDLISATHEIIVQNAKVHIEHKNSNRWNWQDAFSRKKILRYVNKHRKDGVFVKASDDDPPENNESDEGSHFSLAAIHFDGLKIEWVEELPSNSKGGLINRARSELFIDDISLVVKNIVGLFQSDDQPMDIDFDGRTADGVIQASGEINLFSWGTPESESKGKFISVSKNKNNSKLVWMPTMDLNLYLENVGAAALGQMVPDSAIRATEGAMTGEIQVVLNTDQIIDFSTRMSLDNMSWEVNETSTANKGKRLTYAKRGLKKYKNKSIEIVTSSKGRIGDKNFRVIPSLQTAITREAVSNAPQSVYRVAKNDQLRYEDRHLSPLAKSLKKTAQTLEQVEKLTESVKKIDKATSVFKKFLPFDKFPF